jgi:hypothetical protein
MGRKRGKNRIGGALDVAKEARRRAREAVGQVPAARFIPDKRRKPPKHKKRILEEEM